MKLGAYLVKAGLIDDDTLAKALEMQKVQRRRLGQILVDMGVVDEVILAKTLSRQLKIPYGRLKGVKIAKEVIDLVSPELAETHLVLPTKRREKSLVVAMADPLDLNALNDLRFFTQLHIVVAVAPAGDIWNAIERHYPKEALGRDLDTGPAMGGEIEFIRDRDPNEKEAHELLVLTEMPPVVRFTNSIIADAIKQKASDIHIEPQKTSILIRYRVDGILREIMQADKHLHAGVVSRIKVISNIDIAIKRKPQDGKAQVKHGDKTFDLRVSTLPTSYGEKVTIRILDPATAGILPEDLGFGQKDLKLILDAIHRPQGIILATGPTGSGKSSTLYAFLNNLKSPEVNIVTVEDPVEYDIAGINQVQINPAAGINFAAGLRSILRQDPDIVMVGEIRDSETAITAFQAAQTGHLVLSTLHTNDAPSAVIRLMDLNIDPFLISASLIAVVGQRLVRKICPQCKVPDSLSTERMEAIRSYIPEDKDITFWKGVGCETCRYTGYLGRTGLYEVLIVTPALQGIIAPGLSTVKLKKEAEKEGFRGMAMDGIAKAMKGLTTIDEVFRAAPPDAKESSDESRDQMDSELETATEQAALAEPEPTVRSASPNRILVVDDSTVVREMIRHNLEAEGYLIITAKDGIEALKTVSAEKPDLIVLDYLMPKMDGLKVIKELKSQLSTRFIPIIMLTAKDEMEAEVESFDAGADDYLTKPFVPERLLVRIKRLLNK
ncbi:MAG: ATPase, T2SS/T4P/T4SS family [Desulfobacteraceae bacterium]